MGNTHTYKLDAEGNLLTDTYPNGEKDTYTHYPNGQLNTYKDRYGVVTTYTYDGNYNMVTVTDPKGYVYCYTYDSSDNLSAITYPDGTQVLYEYDLNDNLVKVTDREGLETTYVYDAINRITEIHRPNGISTYNTYNARNQIVELQNICDDCGWVVSQYSYTYDERGFIVAETAIESLAGYAYDDKHSGKHEDGRHDELYPHGTKHAKHDKDATFAYQIVETDRVFTYDDAGKLLSATETEDNYGSYVYTYEYDLMGNRTAVIKTNESGTVVESEKYVYNESNQLVSVELYDGKKTTSVSYTYDADGNLISQVGQDGTDKVELYYSYTVENRLEAVYDKQELLMAAAYDGDGNRVFQLNYNLHTDDDWKGNSGNGNGSNKDNNGNGSNSNGNGNGNNGNGNGNATNAETNNSQNQSGILFPIDDQVSDTEEYLISLIKTNGKEKNYELIEYINDVNREYTEVLVEQNINGALDTAYVYGTGRLSLDRFDGTSGYYLYDPRGSVTGITNEEGQVYQSYRYSVTGEVTFGAPQYENEYTYNGESYNPNIQSQYLRARYYCVVTATFITEDSYLGDIAEPLTLNRYNYCLSSYLNYADPSGNISDFLSDIGDFIWDLAEKHAAFQQSRLQGAVDAVWQPALEMILEVGSIEEGIANYLGLWGRPYKQAINENMQWYNGLLKANMDNVESITGYYVGKCEMNAAMLVIGAYESAVALESLLNGVKLARSAYNVGGLLGRLVVLVDGSEILLTTEAASEAIISIRWIVSNARAGDQISQSHAGSGGGSGANAASRYGIDMDNLNFSNTVQNHTGRPYQDYKLLINDIIESKPPIADPQGTSALYWEVEGSFNGSSGIYELLIDPESNTVWHFLFKKY